MIELRDITYRYTRKGEPALRGINARIAPGIHLLAGENGAGKTTLLHLIAGVSTPTLGEVLIDGTPSSSCKPSEMGRTFLVEENMAFPAKSIREFAAAHSRFYPRFSAEVFEENLKAFGLTGHEPLKQSSTGNRKKAQLAYALALGVDVLLLDEPTNALDIESKEALRKLISLNMHDNQTVIVSTHTVSELESLFEGALMLTHSQLLFAGTEEGVTERLAFNVNRTPQEGALYQEIRAGKVLSISKADPDGEPTRADWRMLYSALHSPQREQITKVLTER